MATADELERLVALKEKGALSQEEFERAKSKLLSPPKKTGTLGTAIKALLAIGLLFVAGSIWYYNIATNGTGIPACESAESTRTLKNAFDGSQIAKTLNVSVIEIMGAKETHYDDAKRTRFCTARIRMNNTNQVPVKFDMTKRDSGGFLLQFQITKDDVPTTVSGIAPSPPETTAAPASVEVTGEVATLIDKVDQLNDKCRGGSGDDPATSKACDQRDLLAEKLQAMGWCWGNDEQSGFEKKWQRCTKSAGVADSGARTITYKYEPTAVTVQGKLLSAPGETPDGKKITFPALQLAEPITVQGDQEIPTEKGVVLIHMVLEPKMMEIFKSLKGKSVSVTGTMFHSDNGNHQTNVLITPSAITPTN